jgi:hypothetical protein
MFLLTVQVAVAEESITSSLLTFCFEEACTYRGTS